MYHHTKFEPPNAFHKIHVNVQSCIRSTIIFIQILQLFGQANPKNPENVISIKYRKKGSNVCLFA